MDIRITLEDYNNTKNIDTLLPCPIEFKSQYDTNIDSGKKFLSKQKILFIGLARNIENTIKNSIEKLISVGKNAKEYKIIVFENDSKDKTKEILLDLSKNNKNIILLSETNNRVQFGPTKEKIRTIALAEYRNKLKEYIKENFLDYDFVVVSDMDFVDFSENGCYNSFGWFNNFPNDIDAIAGNSFEFKCLNKDNDQKTLWNYDSWAFRYNWWNEISSCYGSSQYSSMLWFGFFIMPPGLSLIMVNSAFGGMAIYKTKKYILGTYDGNDCEHVTFHYDLKKNFPEFKLYLNTSQIMLV
jgi:hypothetical protein